MTYTATDARAVLAPKSAASAPPSSDAIALPALHEFRSSNGRPLAGGTVPGGTAPGGTAPGRPLPGAGRQWLIRAQNLVLEYSVLGAGDTLSSDADPDEAVVLTVRDDAAVTLTWGTQVASLTGKQLAVVPPGSHAVTAQVPTQVVRLFTTTLADRAAAAANAADYAVEHPRVAPLRLWPEPIGGAVLRQYRLADYPPQPGRFGTIFRSRAFMVNFLPVGVGPRDPNALSPHSHDDFEQISLAVDGEYVHHIRTPWTSRRGEWVDDVHWRTAAPSAVIIPPPTVHTSENVGPGANVLIDIFSPPRGDFSAQAGWVLNADDYPAR